MKIYVMEFKGDSMYVCMAKDKFDAMDKLGSLTRNSISSDDILSCKQATSFSVSTLYRNDGHTVKTVVVDGGCR